MRKIVALTAAAGLLVTLAGCTVTGPSGACDTPLPSGKTSDVVSATGSFGADPKAEFPTPISGSDAELERSVVSAGDGEIAYPGDYVSFTFTAYDGVTGEATNDPTSLQSVASDDPAGINSVFTCATVGSRIALTVPASASADSAVLIIDIEDAFTGRATGKQEIAAEAGLPSIVTAPDGTPGFTIPKSDAPTELKSSVLITGDGAALKADDRVVLKYTVLNWTTSTQVSSTWLSESGNPIQATLTSASEAVPSGLADGVVTALKGKTIGSQVLVVLPPATYLNGLGLDNTGSPFTAPADATLVIVYDILGVIPSE